jgi:polar amino acid transport system substrate-binding protein
MQNWLIGIFSIAGLGAQWVVSPSSFAADLATIEQRGRLIVAVKDNLRPMGFRDAHGKLQGFEIEIAQRLAQDLLGRPNSVELQPVNNRDRLSIVLDGKVDLTIARVTVTASRSRIVSFSTPYYLDGTGIITRNPAVQTQADIAKQPIAVLNEASTIATLRYKLPQAKLIGVDSYEAARQLLESGQVVGFAADASVLVGWAQTIPGYRVLPFRLSTEAIAIVLPKGLQSDELRRRIDRVLARWQSEGWLQQRATYWGLP